MLLNDGQLLVVEVFSHISDNTGNDGSSDAEPFLPAAAPRPVLDAFEERGSGGRDREGWPSASPHVVQLVLNPEPLLNQLVALIQKTTSTLLDLLLEAADLGGQGLDVDLCLPAIKIAPQVGGQPRGAAPFLPAAASRPVLDAFEERGLGDVIENEGHYSNHTCVGLGLHCWC